MLYKKIRNLLLSILLVVTVLVGGKMYIGNKTHTYTKPFIPTTKTEYKIDMTQFKIKEILATNKMQSLEITVESTLTDTSYDQPRFKFMDGLAKTLTSRKLELSGNYKGIFSYSLDNAVFTKNNDNTYTITLNTKDISTDIVELDSPKTKEQMSIIGRYYSAEDTAKLTYKLQELAKGKLDTQENKLKSLQSVKTNLISLFNNVGIDMNKIIINIEGEK